MGKGNLVSGNPRVYCVSNLLSLTQQYGLFATAIENHTNFKPTEITVRGASTLDRGLRQSDALTSGVAIAHEVKDLVRSLIKPVAAAFDLPKHVESHLQPERFTDIVRHQEGDFLGPHVDALDYDNPQRVVSCVYYFFKEPRGFSGGNLRVYQPQIADLQTSSAEMKFIEFPVRSNFLVMFRSRDVHLVTPVKMRTDDPSYARYSIVGYLSNNEIFNPG